MTSKALKGTPTMTPAEVAAWEALIHAVDCCHASKPKGQPPSPARFACTCGKEWRYKEDHHGRGWYEVGL